jgi:hypothetical protein
VNGQEHVRTCAGQDVHSLLTVAAAAGRELHARGVPVIPDSVLTTAIRASDQSNEGTGIAFVRLLMCARLPAAHCIAC